MENLRDEKFIEKLLDRLPHGWHGKGQHEFVVFLSCSHPRRACVQKKFHSKLFVSGSIEQTALKSCDEAYRVNDEFQSVHKPGLNHRSKWQNRVATFVLG